MASTWLLRTSSNFIAGPYSRDQLVALIHEGKLGLQDEICQSNGYWIYLHEHQEVERQLGIRLPRGMRGPGPGEDEEVTETQTETVGLEHPPQNHHSGYEPSDGSTTVAIPRRVAQGNAVPRGPRHQSLPQVSVSPQLESASVWRGLAWILVITACGVVVAVLKVLRSG